MRVRIDTEQILPEFLTRYALSKIGRNFIESRAKTTTMTTINQQDLSEMLVPVVEIPEQQNLIHQLDEIDLRRETIQDHLHQLKILKASLLNDWLS